MSRGDKGAGPDRRATLLLPDEDTQRPGEGSLRRAVRASPRLLIAIAVCVVVVAAVVVSVLVSGGGTDSQSTRDAPPARRPDGAQPAPGPGAKRLRDGVAVGYTRTRAGAVAAAVNYEMARTRPDYFTDADLRHKVLAAMMSREALAAQRASDDTNTAAVVSRLGLQAGGRGPGGSRFLARGAALGTRVTSFSEQVATVDVWMAEVTGVMGDGSTPLPPTAAWTTYRVTLTWQDEDWKVASLTASAGPIPVSGSQNPTGVTEWQSNGGFDAPPPVS